MHNDSVFDTFVNEKLPFENEKVAIKTDACPIDVCVATKDAKTEKYSACKCILCRYDSLKSLIFETFGIVSQDFLCFTTKICFFLFHMKYRITNNHFNLNFHDDSLSMLVLTSFDIQTFQVYFYSNLCFLVKELLMSVFMIQPLLLYYNIVKRKVGNNCS